MGDGNSSWLVVAMFGLGLVMALQPRIIACGNSVASFALAVRCITGSAVMAAASIAVGLRGVLLHIEELRDSYSAGAAYCGKEIQESKHLTVSNVRTMKMNDDALKVVISPEAKYIVGALLDSTVK
ncbi:hypothetical protein Drorol1_Dr00000207, partial [Drosera rotundifolia]